MNAGVLKGDPMNDKTIPTDYRVDVGRADQGRTFVRVVHVPTGKDRTLIGSGDFDLNEVATKLANEPAKEIGENDSAGKPPSDVRRKKIVG
jgi:hypothetical protein